MNRDYKSAYTRNSDIQHNPARRRQLPPMGDLYYIDRGANVAAPAII